MLYQVVEYMFQGLELMFRDLEHKFQNLVWKILRREKLFPLGAGTFFFKGKGNFDLLRVQKKSG